MICIAIYSMNFVWKIEIKGNQKISSEDIITYLKEYDIEIGKKKRSSRYSEVKYI